MFCRFFQLSTLSLFLFPMHRTIHSIQQFTRRRPKLPSQCLRPSQPPTRLQHTTTPAKPRRSPKLFTLSIITLGSAYFIYTQFVSEPKTHTLNNHTFTPFVLDQKEAVSSTSAIFTLHQTSLPGGTFDAFWKKGIWSIEIKQPQLQIARAYTPLPPLSSPASTSSSDEELRLLIRKERNGEVSGYIHALPLSSALHLRGPKLEYEIPANVTEILFLAGGTGIAPALQLAHTLQDTRIHVLWSNRLREDCTGARNDTLLHTSLISRLWTSVLGPAHHDSASEGAKNGLVKQIEEIQQQQQQQQQHRVRSLKIDYFVDEEHTYITRNNVFHALLDSRSNEEKQGRATTVQEKDEEKEKEAKKLIFVSGPQGFIDHWAGPKVWSNGIEVQGPLAGLLSTLDLRGWEVVKL